MCCILQKLAPCVLLCTQSFGLFLCKPTAITGATQGVTPHAAQVKALIPRSPFCLMFGQMVYYIRFLF